MCKVPKCTILSLQFQKETAVINIVKFTTDKKRNVRSVSFYEITFAS